MSPAPRPPVEPTPRFPEGAPAFVPPPNTARSPGKPGTARAGPPPPQRHRTARAPRPGGPTPRVATAALLAAGVALAVYAWGAAPSVLSGDSAELAAAASRGGVPHATGYPSFV